MSHRKSILAAIVLAAGVLSNAPVVGAQPRLEISPFAGYYIASDIYNTYSVNGYGSVELTNSFMWGARLTGSNGRAGVEFSYTRTGSDIKSEQPLAGQPRDKFGRVNIDSYDINFLGYQPSGNPRVTPFGLIGFGWSVTHQEIETDFLLSSGANPESHTLFNFNFGLGTRIEMNPQLALRLEGRWRVTDTHLTTSSGLWCDPWGYCYSYASDWYNSGELTGGLSYAFR